MRWDEVEGLALEGRSIIPVCGAPQLSQNFPVSRVVFMFPIVVMTHLFHIHI